MITINLNCSTLSTSIIQREICSMKLCNPLLTCSVRHSTFTKRCTNCSKLHLQHSTPLLTRRHITQAGVHRAWHRPFTQVLLCHTSTDQLLCSPPNPQRSLSVPADPPTTRGPLRVREPVSSFSSPTWVLVSFCFLFPVFLSSYLAVWDFSYPFRCKRSCASF